LAYISQVTMAVNHSTELTSTACLAAMKNQLCQVRCYQSVNYSICCSSTPSTPLSVKVNSYKIPLTVMSWIQYHCTVKARKEQINFGFAQLYRQ